MGSEILMLSLKFALISTFILFHGFDLDYSMTLEQTHGLGKMEMEMSLPLCSAKRLLNGPGGTAVFTAARGKNLLMLMPLPCLSFVPWFLQPLAACSCSCAIPCRYWHSGMCGQVMGPADFSARSVPGPYSWHSHANC